METESKILIPRQPEKVDVSRVRGDVYGVVEFEITGEESYLSKLPGSEDILACLEKGGRVFVTDKDEFKFVYPQTEPNG